MVYYGSHSVSCFRYFSIVLSLSLKYYLINIVLCTILLIEHLSLQKKPKSQNGHNKTQNTERLKDQNEIGFPSNKSGLYF